MNTNCPSLEEYWYRDAPVTLYAPFQNNDCKKRDEIIKQLQEKNIQFDLKEVDEDFISWCVRTGQVDEFPVLALENEVAQLILNADKALDWISKQEYGKPMLYEFNLAHCNKYPSDLLRYDLR